MTRVRAVPIALILAACQGPAAEPPEPARQPAVERPTARFAGPEPTAEAILAWLDGERYRETWQLLPGAPPLRAGTAPHGALLTTYADSVAMEAIERAAHSMPPGAAFLVEDYLADTTLSSISVMVRPDDTDANATEWRFARFGPAGEIDAVLPEACQGCHVQEPDLVFGWELGTPLPVDSTGAMPAATSPAAPGGTR